MFSESASSSRSISKFTPNTLRTSLVSLARFGNRKIIFSGVALGRDPPIRISNSIVSTSRRAKYQLVDLGCAINTSRVVQDLSVGSLRRHPSDRCVVVSGSLEYIWRTYSSRACALTLRHRLRDGVVENLMRYRSSRGRASPPISERWSRTSFWRDQPLVDSRCGIPGIVSHWSSRVGVSARGVIQLQS